MSKLQDVLSKAMQDPDHVSKLENQGLGIKIMVGEEYAKYFADTHVKAKKYTDWAKSRPRGDPRAITERSSLSVDGAASCPASCNVAAYIRRMDMEISICIRSINSHVGCEVSFNMAHRPT